MVGGLSFGPSGAGRPTATLGIKFILLYHILENAVFLCLSVGDLIIFQHPSLRLTSKYSSRLAVSGYAVLGLPLICVALWAVLNKKETPLRCYFYYMAVSVVVNAAYTADALVHFLPCAAGGAQSKALHPNIFQCGHPRGLTLVALIFVVGFQLTMMYPVYTYCEDLKWDSMGPEQRAMAGKPRLPTRRMAIAAQWAMLRAGPLNEIHGRMPGEYGSMYETAAAMGAAQPLTSASRAQLPYLPATRLV
mmetsp:Transcript_74902/g.219421  ORF Transcript_74902/g.219421 Transcript_74902/m.219421 type:complete len:248 (-) Transcript_74902:106-849(-)